MDVARRHRTTIATVVLFALGALIYDHFAPEQYEVLGRVTVHRTQVEAPNASTEESKNRWIWVRDGYAIKDSLLSQDLLSSILAKSNLLQQRYQEFLKDNGSLIQDAAKRGLGDADLQIQFLADFRKSIDVDYLGGDAFTFVITVRDKSAILAKEVVAVLIDRLKSLVIQDTQAAYDKSLLALQEELRRNTTPEIRASLADTYRGLLSSKVLFVAGAARRVEVVQAPSIPLTPIWPKIDRLLILAMVAGLALGLLLEYALGWNKQQLQTA